MSSEVALVTALDIARQYDFGSSHPLRPERVLLTYDHISALGLDALENVRTVEARVATDEEILRAHDPRFVATVRGIDTGDIDSRKGFEFGLGSGDNPIFKNMHAASAAVCGASITAAELVARGQVLHSFNPAGGLHHARRSEASGFCIYNDPAVAIAHVLALHPEWRIMYVDVDVHHGDGVQWIFYDDPRVLTLSLHESGRYLYPGTGFEEEVGLGPARGTAANLPLQPHTGEDEYLWALEELLTGLAEAFRPNLILTQLGADTHHGDPLADLSLTLPAYPRMARILHRSALEYAEGRWVATGGGGYQAETIVPKVWTMHFAEMCGAPQTIPAEWTDDVAPGEVARPYKDQIERTVTALLATCVPRLKELATV